MGKEKRYKVERKKQSQKNDEEWGRTRKKKKERTRVERKTEKQKKGRKMDR